MSAPGCPACPDCGKPTTYSGQGGGTGPVSDIYRCPDGHETTRTK